MPGFYTFATKTTGYMHQNKAILPAAVNRAARLLLACLLPVWGCAAQPVAASLPGIQYSQGILAAGQHVFVLGKTMQPGGTACFTTVKKLNGQLKEVWSLNIDSAYSNVFTQMQLVNDTLLVTGVQAARSGTGYRYLRYISSAGKMLAAVNLGPASTDDVCSSINGGSRTALAFLRGNQVQAAVTGATGQPRFYSFAWTNVLPAFTLLTATDVLVLGNYNKDYTSMTQPFFQQATLAAGNGKPQEKMIATREDEYLAQACLRDKTIDLVILSNPFNANQQQYVKIAAIDFSGNIVRSKKLLLSQAHWQSVSRENVFADAGAVYLLVKKEQDVAHTYLARIDYQGRLLREYLLPGADNYLHFAVTNGRLFLLTAHHSPAAQTGTPDQLQLHALPLPG